MLRITKEADYGIMMLAHITDQPFGMVHTAKHVASACGLSVPMVSKILRSLAKEGILTSHRGATGGYSFDRSANTISVAEVIRAIEGPISLVQCGSDPGVCEQESCCPTRVSWARISFEIEKALEKVPISGMAEPPTSPALRTL
jgi:FeS assembly SUF system regulator